MLNICPRESGVQTLGTAAKRWKKIYVDEIDSPALTSGLANDLSSASLKETLLDADKFAVVDASNVLWYSTWEIIKTKLALIFATLNSPTLTGIPLTPTAVAGTNTTQIASTEFVASAISVHTSDTSRAHAASAIENVPAGNITSATVQAAINELDEDISQLASDLGDLPSDMQGATSESVGVHGYVPAPAAGDQNKVLKGDGTWGTGIPTGTVFNFASSTPPEGFLVCNGAAISRTTYAGLYAIIGIVHGSGDGSATFNLPNLTDNRFVEGSATVGTTKDAGLPNIVGTMKFAAYKNSQPANAGAFYLDGNGTNFGFPAGSDAYTQGLGFDASRSSTIYGAATTVQPKSLTLLPCIKY